MAAGAHVRVLARSAARASDLRDHGAEVIEGDITDPEAVNAAVEGAEIIYHLAGRLFVPGVSVSTYRRTHVDGTALLLGCASKSATVKRFVHCSTTGVLGITGDRPAAEDAPIRPTNIYEATKAEGEALVRGAGRRGFPIVVARPGLVYGPGDLHLLPFFRAVLAGRFRPIGRQPVCLHPVYIDDLTEGLVRCGTHARAVGECFNLAGPAPVSLAELAAAIARAGGTRPPAGHIPLPAAIVAAAVADRLPRRLRSRAPLSRSRLEFLTHSRIYEIRKAQRLLGFTATTDISTGAARTVDWYADHGHLSLRASSAAKMGT